MSRDYGYINISKPRPLSPGLSHDLQLLRDLEIGNARAAAELGPLPPGGLPVVQKPKFIPPQSATPPAQAHANLENQEKAMKLSQMVTIAALAVGVSACEPSSEPEMVKAQSIPSTANSQTHAVATQASYQPKETNNAEGATASATPEVPDEILAFVPAGSTLLAYKRFDLTGDGTEDAVLIIHHPTSNENTDFSKNPCDMVVLHGEGSGFRLAGISSKTVDCTYKKYLERGANLPDDLNYMLELSKNKIACNYEADRPMGTSTFYTFKFSKKRNVWYLSQARHAYKSYDSKWRLYLAIEELNYPADLGFIKVEKFDPMRLRAAFKRNKEIEFFGEDQEGLEE